MRNHSFKKHYVPKTKQSRKIFEHNMLSVAFSLDNILVLKLVCLFLSQLETAIFLYNNFEVGYQYKCKNIFAADKILRKHVNNMIYT